MHNLKNVSVSIPLDSLTVVTGVSGSGKSSLAFDTLYAEGQRRYVASLSAYARQFLDRVERPEVEDIQGICPSLAIRQKTFSRNPRSTVGTVTEINDYLRLLFARIGTTHCPECRRPVVRDSPDRIGDFVLSLPAGTRFSICMPLPLETQEAPGPAGSTPGRARPDRGGARTREPDPSKRLALALPGLQKQGFVRLLIGEKVVGLEEALPALSRNPTKQVHVVVDRLVVQPDIRQRLVEALELCSRESAGQMDLLLVPGEAGELAGLLRESFPAVRWEEHPAGLLVRFSDRFECRLCRIALEEPEPRLFSFNNPYGACPECHGFGNTMSLDFDLVVPDGSLSLAEGAVEPWTKPRYRAFQERALQFAAREGIETQVPWDRLPEEHRRRLIEGKAPFPGVTGFFKRLERRKYKMHVRIFLSRYRTYATCSLCHGARLRSEAGNVSVGDRRITEITSMTIAQAAGFFAGLDLAPHQEEISRKLLEEIRHRLDLLLQAGLDYLTLDRLSSSLSGGEAQRIQLATSLGSMLVGALYVLDEPSIGLHPRDTGRLLAILGRLKDLGNTVLVVEHDPDIMAAADHIIDLGPHAGDQGGRVTFEGSYQDLLDSGQSLTGRYLGGGQRIPVPLFRRNGSGKHIEIRGAVKHNLKDLTVRIPLGAFVCVTGVSGSGKSTLVHSVLCNNYRKAASGRDVLDGCAAIRGLQHISDLVLVDQSPIGRTPRSNPVTYIKAFDLVRSLFAGTQDARSRNLKPGHFSFNISGGRCDNCQGNGAVTVEMQFLADVELPCEECRGTRFKSSVLDVRFKGRNIAEVLDMTVKRALEFFSGNRKLVRMLRVLDDVGLGYLRLGQSATSLSGGEAQRLKLAAFIESKHSRRVLYVFDEPTTGLHFDDIKKLLAAFDKIMNAGNSILVIEHNMELVKTADWIIDLGPEGGEAGGRILFEGTPEKLAACPESHTGHHLRRLLDPAGVS